MKCMSCPLKYIGQMGRSFNITYKEHVQDIRSKTVIHIIQSLYWIWVIMGYLYGSITDTMEVIKVERKVEHLNTLERYHIYMQACARTHTHNLHFMEKVITKIKYKHEKQPWYLVKLTASVFCRISWKAGWLRNGSNTCFLYRSV
jgi:hypothetical protein